MSGSRYPGWTKGRWLGMPQTSPAVLGFEARVAGGVSVLRGGKGL